VIRVFHDHRLVAEYPSECWETTAGQLPPALKAALAPGADPDDLLILKGPRSRPERAVPVARHAAGTWHGAGEGIICGFLEDQADCPNCGHVVRPDEATAMQGGAVLVRPRLRQTSSEPPNRQN